MSGAKVGDDIAVQTVLGLYYSMESGDGKTLVLRMKAWLFLRMHAPGTLEESRSRGQ